ncbi:MAG: hypothetical protein JRJ75_00010 [Deltaproteobacteria bacterium]|nr:hypothetical protein [Deltaproteobacteria bacterium]MBW1927620.1 hypothetical protein [Deltaproteobacteria bacterium]MBW2025572.1 hypothetical protein [Deltaproteobacteria bacterium]RLB23960.1 MAG: hypothetical protein DRG76_02835 [Deltaproteobacteria bacterium]
MVKVRYSSIIIVMICCLLLALGWASLAQGAEVPQSKPQRSALGVIIAKDSQEIVLKGGRYFRISMATRFFDQKNRPLTLRRLPVPCVAEIEYDENRDGPRYATVVTVREVLPGAHSGFMKRAPE